MFGRNLSDVKPSAKVVKQRGYWFHTQMYWVAMAWFWCWELQGLKEARPIDTPCRSSPGWSCSSWEGACSEKGGLGDPCAWSAWPVDPMLWTCVGAMLGEPQPVRSRRGVGQGAAMKEHQRQSVQEQPLFPVPLLLGEVFLISSHCSSLLSVGNKLH